MNTTLLNRLLNYYNITKEDYDELILPVDESNFSYGNKFNRIDEAVEIVKETIKNNGKIFIYGDYDADGVMGTSILVKMFKYVNYEVDSYLPNRYQDGYGLTMKKAIECVQKNMSLVITVDNGVSCIEQIKYLKDNGIKVLVLDHHQIQSEIPNADVILHPTYSDFGETPSSGAFVAFMFSISFLNRFDPYLATLASISLISDMMPLKKYNRNLLRLCIQNYKDGAFPQIDLLKEGDVFNETSIGMRIAPKINAVGRLLDSNEINNLVTYFTTDSKSVMLTYLEWINSTNEERKVLSKESVDNLKDIDENIPAICYVTEAKEGLLGLISNHLMTKYHKPTIVLALDKEKNIYKGSCRAPEGFNIVDMFTSLSDDLIVFGGHAMAGGCSIEASKIDSFRSRFVEYARTTPLNIVEKEVIDLGLTELNFDNYRLIQTFAPFGEDWKAPLFKLHRILTSSLMYSKTGEHIITSIGYSTKLTGFNISKQSLSEYHFVNLTGTVRLSSFKGINKVEFLISNVEESRV